MNKEQKLDEIAGRIPENLKINQKLEFRESSEGKPIVGIYIRGSCVGWIDLNDAEFDSDLCESANQSSIFCNKCEESNPDATPCSGTSDCDNVKKFIEDYKSKYSR